MELASNPHLWRLHSLPFSIFTPSVGTEKHMFYRKIALFNHSERGFFLLLLLYIQGSNCCCGGGRFFYLFPTVFIFWFILSNRLCTPGTAFMHGCASPHRFSEPNVWLLAFQVGEAPLSSCSHLLKWIFAQYWLALNPQQCLSFACGIQGSSPGGRLGDAREERLNVGCVGGGKEIKILFSPQGFP